MDLSRISGWQVMARVSRATLVLFGLLVVVSTARSSDFTPHELLDRMNEAVRKLDYEGRFVVQSAERLDALYIVHRVSQGTEKERVVWLTGEPREIIRSDEAVACLLADRKGQIKVGLSPNGGSFSPLRGVSGSQLDASYQMELLEPGRVAGRDSYQILIRPHDDLRYGYRLFVDQATFLPLRSVMFDETQEVVSQVMFIELQIGGTVPPIEHDISAMQIARVDPQDNLMMQRLAPAQWTYPNPPPGFRLDVHRRKPVRGSSGQREHFVFSDGLARVSVYVQPAGKDGGLSGVSSLGPANAVGRLIGSHEVIAVGEVPTKTLNWFTENIVAATP